MMLPMNCFVSQSLRLSCLADQVKRLIGRAVMACRLRRRRRHGLWNRIRLRRLPGRDMPRGALPGRLRLFPLRQDAALQRGTGQCRPLDGSLLPQRGRARPQKGNKQQREKQPCAHQPVPPSSPDFTIIIIFYRFGNCRISRPKNCSVWQACASLKRESILSV